MKEKHTGNHPKNKQPSSVSLQHRKLESPALQSQLHSSINEQHSLSIMRMFTFTTDFFVMIRFHNLRKALAPQDL